MRKHLLLVPLFLALTACAVMQEATPPAPDSVAQSLILAGHEAAAVVHASTDSFEQGLLSVEAHRAVIKQAKVALTAIDTARGALDVGDITTAQGQLEAARTILTTLRSIVGGDR